MRSRLIAVSQFALRDAGSNLLTLVNVLDDVQAEGFPVFFADVSVTLLVEREPQDGIAVECRLRVDLDHRIEIMNQPITVNFHDPGTPLGRLMIKMNGFVIPEPGRVTFALVRADDDVAIATAWINVSLRAGAIQIEQPPPGGEAPPAQRVP